MWLPFPFSLLRSKMAPLKGWLAFLSQQWKQFSWLQICHLLFIQAHQKCIVWCERVEPKCLDCNDLNLRRLTESTALLQTCPAQLKGIVFLLQGCQLKNPGRLVDYRLFAAGDRNWKEKNIWKANLGRHRASSRFVGQHGSTSVCRRQYLMPEGTAGRLMEWAMPFTLVTGCPLPPPSHHQESQPPYLSLPLWGLFTISRKCRLHSDHFQQALHFLLCLKCWCRGGSR